MIEYVEVRRKSDREIIGIIDGAKSVIWHSVYYGVGDFEIYAIASEKNIELLQKDYYITRPNNDEIGIIESVTSSYSTEDGKMIVASGRFAKSILDRRQIYNLSGKTNTATILSGKVESAVRSLVVNNIISCSFDTNRNVSYLKLGALANIPAIIVDENGNATQKQVSYENLFDYTEEVLKEYKLGARITLDDSNNNFLYTVYQGADRSADNTDGNEPIVFSQEYDNLSESNYSYNNKLKKTAALIGGEGEGLDRFYSLVAGTETGLERRETWIDASSINKTYKDDEDVEHTYTDPEYKAMLDAEGKQQLATKIAEESYEGSINVDGGIWKLNEDYYLGDIVTFQDNKLDKYASVRITELTEVQDENGYAVTPVFNFELDNTENTEVITTESGLLLMSESGVALKTETTTANTVSSTSNSSEINGVKISELPESTDIQAGCCLPIVSGGETKKVYFSTLENKLAQDIDVQAITSTRIDEICV